jgi:hypothetical protein
MSPTPGRIVILACAIALMAAPRPSAGADNPVPSERELKAACLYNFLKFVEWPENAFPAKDSPIVMAVVGEREVARVIEQVVADKKAQDRSIKVLSIEGEAINADVLKSCHVVFVSSSARQKPQQILPTLAERHVLTVGEAPGFCEADGMINFRVQENRIRFEINVSAADLAGMKISSKILRLAVRVLRNPPAKPSESAPGVKPET